MPIPLTKQNPAFYEELARQSGVAAHPDENMAENNETLQPDEHVEEPHNDGVHGHGSKPPSQGKIFCFSSSSLSFFLFHVPYTCLMCAIFISDHSARTAQSKHHASEHPSTENPDTLEGMFIL